MSFARNDITTGARVPNVELAFATDDIVEKISTWQLFAKGKTLAIGVPGAFTPVCTKEHIPDLVRNADRLTEAGFTQLLCIAPNDPYVLNAWSRIVDPQGKVRFVSDGNLSFCTAMGVAATEKSLFMGRRSDRYLLSVNAGIIQRLKVESTIVACCDTKASCELRERPSIVPEPQMIVRI